MIDTHCHLLYPGIAERLDPLLNEARGAGVSGFITIGTTTSDSIQSTALADRHADVWCTSGVHPLHSNDPCTWTDMRKAGEHPKCVAWGELGLDNHWPTPDRLTQRRVLEEQLAHILEWRAQGLDKPVVIHCRRAVADLLPILKATALPPERFVFHCFTEGPDDARAVLDFGAWISFTGVVTFENAEEVKASVRLVPNDRIMCETDAPYLSPEPVRKQRPCVPAFVMHTARALARLRAMDMQEFDALTDANATRFFGLNR
jgi:TatD DNase family protein